ncbi:MAG: DUF1593 domain-containing protein [Prolixibacteraceae bacterium]|nr:DUF1593 domain-containing protein [Prolixibacteraceae bacterium]MBT6766409.1 DUF1593 domain-containing protein [Prolixibacteraceae bacterium]MBT6998157.1 DUF1593 domain-containing protein [Prolixibacteraceae bacterium]MBT7395699.1 DUF1593 domain-containing protein [Prolixibacteraceae bacterium]
MKPLLLFILLFYFSIPFYSFGKDNKPDKHRILILTDIENEPDDAESLVRFLLYSNQFDVEGIVATTSCWQRDKVADWRIHEIVDAYGEVRDNLEKHESGYPEHSFLKERIKKGYTDFGMNAVGKGKDSEGSDWIIKTVDKDDPRPVWVPIWGGSNCLAQALWKVKNTRSGAEVEKFVKKLRVYTISDQDNSGPWIRNTFKELFYIVSPGYHEGGADSYYYATWTGISGERHYHFPSGANKYIVDNDWVDKNIQINHGALGEQYPDVAYIMEGDSPSFMYLINNGLGSPENPNWGSWGGRYELYQPHTQIYFHEPETRPIWTNARDWVKADGIDFITEQATIWRWRTHFQNDFAARMDWCISSFENANHAPIVRLNQLNNITVKSDEMVDLDASTSFDPDQNELTFEWIYYREAGNFSSKIELKEKDKAKISFKAPKVTKQKSIHLIVAVTDNGEPNLTSYQRTIITVNP